MADSPWTQRPRLLALRRRSRTVDVALVAVEGFRIHRTGRMAALVAHYGFLSLFPLFLVATTVVGFVLDDRPDLQEDIIDSFLSRIPIIGETISTDPSQLTGSVPLFVFGLATALWASLKAFVILRLALDDVADVALDDRPGFARARLNAFSGLAIIGSAQLVSVAITTFMAVSGVRTLHEVLLTLAAVAINTALLAATYLWMCTRPLSWRRVLPGAAIGGVLFALLQIVGTTLVARSIARATPVYGSFATVIALIGWLSLHSTITLGGAELNRALVISRAGRRDPAISVGYVTPE